MKNIVFYGIKIYQTFGIFKKKKKRDSAEGKLMPISGLTKIKDLRAKIRSIRGTYN